ncbi:MAG TPA: M23 family metallopeptidase [Candidatus Acidoferrales bacterium]|nr:M23 family metallopeptidase [Candidatus Acidoferrales bacterium]
MRVLLNFSLALLFPLILCFGRVNTGNSKSSSNDTYLFPTDASHRINSGFADYRSSHFHGGMDISTNGKIGYQVFAAKSGYVYRVSVSPFGYGKMLILKHDDSTFTLYGHLSVFSEKIEEMVGAAQRQEHKYGVELRFKPDEIRVDRGEVVAYTGATGVGGPHLHFEVRDKNFAFIDPLVFGSLDVPDYRTPRIFNIAVRGFLSGEAKVCSMKKSGDSYSAKQIFRMSEPFYFVLHGADSYGGKFKRPPKYIRLKIDGNDFISLNLTHFDADDYLDVASLVDLGLSRRLKTYYILCVNRAIPFSVFTPDTPLSGLIGENFPNGTHSYEISIEDEDGNGASASGKFVLNLPRSSNSSSDATAGLSISPFKEKVFNLSPSLTLRFPENSFAKEIDIDARLLSQNSLEIESENEMLRKKVELTWRVNDPTLRLYRRLRRRWSYIECSNDGSFLRAKIGYRTGVFALLHDEMPPIVGKIRFSNKNPFYRSAAPKDFKRDFVYFKVSDRLSGVNTDNIFLKVGDEKLFCEYDSKKHSAVCQVDADKLRDERKVEIIVSDNAGNERRVVSRIRF